MFQCYQVKEFFFKNLTKFTETVSQKSFFEVLLSIGPNAEVDLSLESRIVKK